MTHGDMNKLRTWQEEHSEDMVTEHTEDMVTEHTEDMVRGTH